MITTLTLLPSPKMALTPPSTPPSTSPAISIPPSTASRPRNTTTTPFDPLSAYLDEQWHTLDLTPPCLDPHSSPPTPSSPSPPPPTLNLLSSQASELSSALSTYQSDFAELERQLRSALSDADATDAAYARLHADHLHIRHLLESEKEISARLGRSARSAQTELAALNDCLSTLHAAHQVEARIHDLLIADQAEEIRQLRQRVAVLEREGLCLRRALGRAAVIGVRKGWISGSATLNDGWRKKEMNELKRRKDALFRGYERRYSTTVESVVKRTSTMLITDNSVEKATESTGRSTDAGTEVSGKVRSDE